MNMILNHEEAARNEKRLLRFLLLILQLMAKPSLGELWRITQG